MRFGIFELDPEAAELHRSGRRVALTGQPMLVLIRLVERAGEIVTRDELRREIWGDDTHVDFEAGISTCINQIRSALGDTAASPRFIETVPRRGYRFIAGINIEPKELSQFWRGNLAAVATLVGVVVIALLAIPIRARWSHKPIPLVVLPVNVETPGTGLAPLSDSLTDVLIGALATEAGDRARVAGPKAARELLRQEITEQALRRFGAEYYVYVALRSIDSQVLMHLKLIELNGGWVVMTSDRVMPPEALARDQLRIAREVSRAIVNKLSSLSN